MTEMILLIGLTAAMAVAAAQAYSGGASGAAADEGSGGRLSWWEKLVYGFTLLCAAVLAITGIGSFVFSSSAMTGWTLMLHATAAPPFAVAIAALALTWSNRCCGEADSIFDRTQRVLFWLMVLTSIVVILSAVIPMTPLFGTPGQEFLYHTHQYSSLILTVIMIIQGLLLLRGRR